jgi:molybdate transport system substrate-binding protein
MLNRLLFTLFLFSAVLFSLPAHADELLVSAAISLKNAFEEIGPLYEKHAPGVTVRFNFGSSGALEKQIEAGAPADVYASASQRFMNMLAGKNGIMPETRCDFAQNSMVLISPRGNPAHIESLADVSASRCRNIAIGNPRSVPAGRYAADVLRHAGLYQRVQNKLAFGEHVRQVLDYVARGEVDAGIVYATDARVRSKEITVIATAPPESHTPVLYPIAVVAESSRAEQAQRLVRFICTDSRSQAVLQKHGFSPVRQKHEQ